MSISTEITKLNTNLTNSYTACQNKGATMPANQNFDNLATCVSSIPTATEPTLASLTITPSTTEQTITPPSGTDGYNTVIASAVTASIDSDIVAGNIKSGVNILGVNGTVTELVGTTTTITQNGTYAPTSPSNGFTSVSVNVSGGGGGTGIPREVSAQGVYQMPTTSFTFSLPSNATDVGSQAMYYALQKCTGLTSVDLSSLTTVSGSYAMYLAFYNCTNLTNVDLSSLTTVSGNQSMNSVFQDCTGLTSVDLSSLTTVSGNQILYNLFNNCSNLTNVNLSNLMTLSGESAIQNIFSNCINLTSLDLSSLTTVSGKNAMRLCFQGCTSLTSVDLSSLTTVSGNTALAFAFRNCTSLTTLSFPSLTSTSFDSYTNQFNNMLGSVTGCTVHFPSNLQSVIGSWSDVTAGFGGTNTTVLFDLPATT